MTGGDKRDHISEDGISRAARRQSEDVPSHASGVGTQRYRKLRKIPGFGTLLPAARDDAARGGGAELRSIKPTQIQSAWVAVWCSCDTCCAEMTCQASIWHTVPSG